MRGIRIQIAGHILRAGVRGEGASDQRRAKETPELTYVRVMADGRVPGSAWQPSGPTPRLPAGTRQFADWHLDPQEGVHRQSLVPGGTTSGPFMRHATLQDKSVYEDEGRYPRPRRSQYPQAMDEGYYVGHVTDSLVARGEDVDNQGLVPQRIPRLWEDKLAHWEGLRTHGAGTVGLVAHNNHWFYAHHPIPRYPTRGYRSLSGVLAPDGPTSSRARIPAVYVPTSVG